MMNQQTISRDIQFLQEAAEKIAGLNSSSAVTAPIQEGDVSSSNPPILATELFGSALQELQGFLFVVNSQGKIVSVTDNITEYLGYQPSEWPDASIYDFLHVTNHASFSQNILSPLGEGKVRVDCNKVLSPFPCRMRRGSSNADGTEGKRDEQPLVHVQISSLPRRIERFCSPSASTVSGCQMYLICVAQKVDDPVALWTRPMVRSNRRFAHQLFPSPHPISSTKSHARVDFAMQLNTDWVILACDFSGMGLSNELSHRFVGNKFTQFVHNNDFSLFQKYADSVTKGGSEGHPSNIYRFKLTDTRNVFVHSRAQLSTSTSSGGGQLIVAKHSIVRDCDANELKGSASSSLMNAIIQCKSQGSTATLDSLSATSCHPPPAQLSTLANYGLSSGNQYQSEQVSSGDNRQLYQPPGGLVQQPSSSLSATMMSGVPQTPDLNFNDVYTSSRNRANFGVYENGFNWGSSSSSQMLQQQTQGHNMLPQQMRGDSSMHNLQPTMLTDMNSLNTLDSKSTVPTLPSYTTSYQGEVQQLSQSGANGKLRELLSSVATPSAQQSMSVNSGSNTSVIASLADSNTVPISPSSTSSSSKVSEQHHLLKQLLSEEPQVDDSNRPDRKGILQKLLKDDDKEATSVRKSPPTSSPGNSSVSSSRRHSSGGSSKDSKVKHSEDGGRANKRKLSTSTTAAAITEPDSTATASTTNATLLNHLLTIPLSTSAKVDPHEITATPLEKLKAQRIKARQSNVIDVVDNTIMHGTEVMDMERFTAMDGSMYQRQNSTGSLGGYSNGQMYPSNSHPGQMANSMDTGLMAPQPDTPMANNYDSKNFFTNNLGASIALPSHIQQQQQPTSRSLAPPMHFQQTIKSESMDSDSSASMLQQLLNPDSDNSIFQELENLLGDSSSMQLTSPEDERAIKNIEKQLLDGTESLCPNKSFPNNPADPHSPGFPMGLTNVPASASNPVLATAIYNIHHKPPISNSHNPLSYESPTQSKPQLQHPLRVQLQQQQQQQQGMSRGQSSIRPNHKQLGRQGSGSGRSMSQSSDGKMRRRSGNSPSGSLSSFSPMANGPMGQNMQTNFSMASNFGEMMKSTEPPPNIKLPQDLNSNTFPPRTTDMLRQELVSPRTSRGAMDVPSSPQSFRFPDQYGSGPRSMMPRQMMAAPGSSPYHQDQMSMLSNQQHMTNTNGLQSPQSIRQMESPGGTLPPGGQSNLQPFSHIDQVPNNTVSNSQYVKQEMKAIIAARAQKQITSPQHQNFNNQQHVMSSQQMTMMSPPSARQTKMSADLFSPQYGAPSLQNDRGLDSYQDSVLPDDILDQITELTDTQNEMQQQHQMDAMSNCTSLPNDNAMITNDSVRSNNDSSMVSSEHDMALKKINQSKKESNEVRNQLRALAGGPSKQPDGTLEKVFRSQLAKSLTSKQKTTLKTSIADSAEMDKLKQHSQNTHVNVITVDPRPPVEEMQPNDQRNSILQQLLTDNTTS